ncbi:MAG TPA: DUF1573 domain-containing protein [Firmicutes bacterium]|nr:DUF1573 domain-containing protein [Bacillota bacterium]
MKDLICLEFQDSVSKCLLRHRSILDVLSKLQEATARTNRAVAKSVTCCGCIEIQGSKQRIPAEASLGEADRFLSTHLEGELCVNCREQVEEELGTILFYLAGLCNLLDISLYDLLVKEQKKLYSLGPFTLS